MIDFNEKIWILDGAMGTMLQKEGMSADETTMAFGFRHPEILTEIHRKYIDAGAEMIYASTFGINRFKVGEIGVSVYDAVNAAMDAALKAKEASGEKGKNVKIVLGIGPVGEMLEPMGTLRFEDAYDVFREIIDAGCEKADVVVIETMTDLYEVKAAVLAAKEGCSLPVIASMTFEESGRTFTGVSLEAIAVTLEGLGVDAVGINCSLGPSEIYPLAEKLRSLTKLPILVKPNAGLPDPETGEYSIASSQFAEKMAEYADIGVNMIGGCCGTDPDCISKLKKLTDEKNRDNKAYRNTDAERAADNAKKLKVCSGNSVVTVDHVTVIGERINPTGKKRLKQALLEGDFDYILAQAIEQVDAGAEILDVNVGIPSVNEAELLPEVVRRLQSVTDVPLQIDSSDADAVAAALRVYNGKAIVNSVNGEAESMEKIFPVVKKYGAAVVGLTLDEKGIPAKAEERFEIAERILKKAEEYGISRENVIIDCLTLTASAQQKEVDETLKALTMVKKRLGLKTALGVSNISFGLPLRPVINRTFLAMAMECGLDLPIINPNDEDMMASIYAFHVLKNIDVNASAFIDRYGDSSSAVQSISSLKKNEKNTETAEKGDREYDIFYSIEKGIKSDTVSAVKELLKSCDEMEVVNDYLIPALDRVGKGFEKGTIFLPQMLQSATAAQAGFDVIKQRLAEGDREAVSLGEVVIATVKGDIHDIGKNIVKVIMENYGFRMIDLGRDVPADEVVRAVLNRNIKLVGLSALMTTTLKSMEETIKAVKEAAPDCRVMVGGAVLTADYAKKIGADYYCRDALKSVEAAQEVFNG